MQIIEEIKREEVKPDGQNIVTIPITPVVSVQPTGVIEGVGSFKDYVPINKIADDSGAVQALTFLKTSLSKVFSTSEIISLSKQVVNGINYKLIIKFPFREGLYFNYELTVNKARDSTTFKIINAQYIDLVAEPTFYDITNSAESVPYLPTIDQHVLAEVFIK